MCGYIGNVIDSPLTKVLMDLIGHDLWPQLRNNPGTGPAANIDIVLGEQGPQVQQAIWWLLLEPKDGQFRPSRYTSFNTRSDKLNEKRSAGYVPYRKSRCVVPASYFIEGTGPKGKRVYHRIEPTEHSFALGGLYRTWVNRETGEVIYSCSVITLSAHASPTWQAIHPKSTPLMLPPDPELIRRWLDPEIDAEEFAPLMKPRFHQPLQCVPVERPGNQRQTGGPITISAG